MGEEKEKKTVAGEGQELEMIKGKLLVLAVKSPKGRHHDLFSSDDSRYQRTPRGM